MHLGQTVCPDHKRVDMPSDCHFERTAQVVLAPHVKKLSLETQGSSRRLRFFPLGRDSRIAHVAKQPNSREIRNQLFQEFNTFCGQLGAEGGHPRDIAPRLCEARHDGTRVAHRRHNLRKCFGRVFGRPRGRVPLVTIRSTLRRTSSDARSGNRSARPSADRYSRIRFRPST
jgi:hypothetical protein